MLSKDYSAEFKQRFADRYADGATITMLQHEFGLTKSTVKLWRERIDQGGVGAIDRPGKNNRYPQSSSFASSKPISVARATTKPSPSSMACATARRYEIGRSGTEREARTPSPSIRRGGGGRSPRARRPSSSGAPASRWRWRS